MRIAQKVLQELRVYNGDNEWEVISHFDLDDDAIEVADPSGMSDVAVFTDGSRVVWDETKKEWREG